MISKQSKKRINQNNKKKINKLSYKLNNNKRSIIKYKENNSHLIDFKGGTLTNYLFKKLINLDTKTIFVIYGLGLFMLKTTNFYFETIVKHYPKSLVKDLLPFTQVINWLLVSIIMCVMVAKQLDIEFTENHLNKIFYLFFIMSLIGNNIPLVNIYKIDDKYKLYYRNTAIINSCIKLFKKALNIHQDGGYLITGSNKLLNELKRKSSNQNFKIGGSKIEEINNTEAMSFFSSLSPEKILESLSAFFIFICSLIGEEGVKNINKMYNMMNHLSERLKENPSLSLVIDFFQKHFIPILMTMIIYLIYKTEIGKKLSQIIIEKYSDAKAQFKTLIGYLSEEQKIEEKNK